MTDSNHAHGEFPAPDTLVFHRLLPGPIERVWTYLTESDKRARWLAAGDVEPEIGGRVAMHFHHADLSTVADEPPEKYAHLCDGVSCEGRVTRWEPPRLLTHTWPEDGGAESEVTFELTERGDQVELVLTHRRLGADRNLRLSVSAGWHTHLGILADHLEGREPQPFWSVHARLEEEYGRRLETAPG